MGWLAAAAIRLHRHRRSGGYKMRNAHKIFIAIGVVLMSIAAVFAQSAGKYELMGGVVEIESTTLSDNGYALSGGVVRMNTQAILRESVTTGGYSLTSIIHLQVEPTTALLCTGDLLDPPGVGVEDLIELIDYWGTTDSTIGDLDGNDEVGASDLYILLENWGPCL